MKHLVALLVVLSTLDASCTMIEGGRMVEANHLMYVVMDMLVVFWLWKTLGIALLAWALMKLNAAWALRLCVTVYTVALCWHLIVLIVR